MCKLLNYKDKVKVMNNSKKKKLKKGKNIFVKEDYCQKTMNYRKELWKEVKKLREEGKIADLQYRSIVVKRRNSQG